jgi:hypothetical protein
MENVTAYHGTKENFTSFATKARGLGYTSATGKFYKDDYYDSGESEFVYFASNIDVCKSYGNVLLEAVLNFKNPLILDAKGKHYSAFSATIQYAIANNIDKKTNDSIIILNLRDSLGNSNSETISTIYMVKENNILTTKNI